MKQKRGKKRLGVILLGLALTLGLLAPAYGGGWPLLLPAPVDGMAPMGDFIDYYGFEGSMAYAGGIWELQKDMTVEYGLYVQRKLCRGPEGPYPDHRRYERL